MFDVSFSQHESVTFSSALFTCDILTITKKDSRLYVIYPLSLRPEDWIYLYWNARTPKNDVQQGHEAQV